MYLRINYVIIVQRIEEQWREDSLKRYKRQVKWFVQENNKINISGLIIQQRNVFVN